MAKYLNSAGVTYLWKKIKALLAKPFKVTGTDSSASYTDIKAGSVATGNSDGDQTIIDNNGVTVSGGALTIYEDTSKGGGSVVIDYDEATRLKELKNYTLPAANGTTLGGVKSGGDVTIASGVITVRDDSHNHNASKTLYALKKDGKTTALLQDCLGELAPLASPTFTGTPKAPTAASGTNTTQIATTAFVQAAVESKIAAADAMRFKGTLGTGGTITALPASHKVGDSYKVITAGTYAGQKCEVGDMVICVTAGSTANDAHWTVVQANVDGAVTGPTSAVSGRVAVFNGTTGKVIKDSGFTIAKSVPADAKFTDTTYGLASTSANGLMSKEDKSKLNGAVTGPSSAVSDRVAVFDGTTGKVIKDGGKALSDFALVSEVDDCLYDVTIQELGTGSYGVENGATYSILNLTLGLETYGEETKTVTKTGKITMNEASAGVSGLMPSAMYTKLNGIATGATADSALSNSEIDAAIAAAG